MNNKFLNFNQDLDYSFLNNRPGLNAIRKFRSSARRSGEPWARPYESETKWSMLEQLVVIVSILFLGSAFVIVTTPQLVSFLANSFNWSWLTSATDWIIIIGCFGILILAFAPLIAKSVRIYRYWSKTYRLFNFATDNGLKYQPKANTGLGQETIFHHYSFWDQLSFESQSELAEKLMVGNISPMFDPMVNEHSVINGAFVIEFKQKLPHLYLENHSGKNNRPANSRGLASELVLELEEFGGQFTLYCPEEYREVALQIVTPELLNQLSVESEKFDLELVDNKLLARGLKAMDMLSPKSYQTVLRLANFVGAPKEVTAETEFKDWRSELYGAVDRSRRQLKRRIKWYQVAILVLVNLLVLAIITGLFG